MTTNVTPMIHVPDVEATAEWYISIGFELTGSYSEDDEMNWVRLAYGEGRVMFSSGGHSSDAQRREVDLYVHADRVDETYSRLKDRFDVVEEPHDTFYGMREFIIRDNNRFWLTFGEPTN